MVFTQTFAILTGFVATAFALPSVTVGGRYLYHPDGTRFYIKGIAYQQQGSVVIDPSNAFAEPGSFQDPLGDGAGCARDLPFLQQLGVNTIRAYSVDGSLNHDSCMHALSGAGIYTIIDLSLPVNGSIDRASPAWTTNLLDLYLRTVDAFMKYDNILAFNVGNEVVAQADKIPNVTASAAYIKAAARDVKSYLKSKNSKILVGYASTDGPATWLDPLARYLGCDSQDTSIDLFGLNNYEWCGDSSFQASYAGLNTRFESLNIPAYFSEFGCITSLPRRWTEVQALFGQDMTPNWSGGLAFSYFQANQGYGIIALSADNKTVTTSDDFSRLKAQYANVTFINSPSMTTAGQTQYPTCPQSSTTFLASSSLPPTPNDAVCQCLVQKSFSCTFKGTPSPRTIGSLLDTGCALLGQKGGSCSAIGSSGASGSYGSLSFCDPVTKLDYVMSSFYEVTNRNAQSCDFAGNATVVPNPPAPTAVAPAATSCLSNAQATFTPTAPAGSGSGSTPPSSSSKSGSKPSNAASGFVAIFADTRGIFAVTLMTIVAFIGGSWTLLV